MIVFLSCTKSKLKGEHKAKDLYSSPLFKKSYQYAKSLNPDKIYILSAKYGLLGLNDIISDYEETLNNKTDRYIKQWSYNVCKQLESKGISYNEEVIFLTGGNYHKYIKLKFKNKQIPLQGLGLGRRLQRLNQLNN